MSVKMLIIIAHPVYVLNFYIFIKDMACFRFIQFSFAFFLSMQIHDDGCEQFFFGFLKKFSNTISRTQKVVNEIKTFLINPYKKKNNLALKVRRREIFRNTE